MQTPEESEITTAKLARWHRIVGTALLCALFAGAVALRRGAMSDPASRVQSLDLKATAKTGTRTP